MATLDAVAVILHGFRGIDGIIHEDGGYTLSVPIPGSPDQRLDVVAEPSESTLRLWHRTPGREEFLGAYENPFTAADALEAKIAELSAVARP